MRPVPVEAHERIWRRHLLVLGRGRADEMYLDLIPQARVALEDALDRLQQVDVGSREEVDLRHGHAAEPPTISAGSQLPEPDVRMQIAGVDDAEDALLARCGSSGEIVGIKSVRDRDHDPAAELRERVQHAGHSLGRVHDDGCRLPQRRPHTAAVGDPVCRRRIAPHLVERPRVLEVGDPRNAETVCEAVDRRSCVVGDELADDDVYSSGRIELEARDGVHPPAGERVVAAQRSIHGRSPARRRAGDGPSRPDHGYIGNLAEHRRVDRRPPFCGVAGTGEHERLDAELA